MVARYIISQPVFIVSISKCKYPNKARWVIFAEVSIIGLGKSGREGLLKNVVESLEKVSELL